MLVLPMPRGASAPMSPLPTVTELPSRWELPISPTVIPQSGG